MRTLAKLDLRAAHLKGTEKKRLSWQFPFSNHVTILYCYELHLGSEALFSFKLSLPKGLDKIAMNDHNFNYLASVLVRLLMYK